MENTTDYDKSIYAEYEFAAWLRSGIAKGWITEPFCHTHDGDPYMTEEEEREWEEGGDPCCHVAKFLV